MPRPALKLIAQTLSSRWSRSQELITPWKASSSASLMRGEGAEERLAEQGADRLAGGEPLQRLLQGLGQGARMV